MSRNPDIKILALSSFQDDVSVNAMLKSGAVGYVVKNTFNLCGRNEVAEFNRNRL